MSILEAALLVGLTLPQANVMKRTDRDYDDLKGPVRLVRIESERSSEDRLKGAKPGRELEKIVAYDRDGRVTDMIEYGGHPEGCARARRVYSYNQDGSRGETVLWGESLTSVGSSTDGGKTLTYHQTFRYDASGRWAGVEDYDPLSKPYLKTQYKYDEAGRVAEASSLYVGSEPSICSFKYNRTGMIAEEKCLYSFSGISNTTYYDYEVDSQGNWIRRTASSAAVVGGKKTVTVFLRQIEYFQVAAGKRADEHSKEGSVLELSNLTPCAPLVVRKSGGTFQESATKRVLPHYPADAPEVRGSVLVQISTDETGKVIDVKTISGPSELRRAAEEAARQWEFKPTLLSKVPVRVIGTITFNFNR